MRGETSLKVAKQRFNEQSKISNNIKSNPKNNIVFGNNLWFGFARSVSSSRTPDGYSYSNINTYPNGSYIESPLGYTQVGRHQDNINMDDYEGLIAGEICIDFNRSPDNNQNVSGLFKIIKNKSTQETSFYYLDSDSNWILQDPFQYELGIDDQQNPNPNNKYNFKGSKFDFVVYKDNLYLVSGEEDFINSNGEITGLMKWDGQKWDGIPTGKVGLLKNNSKIGKTNLNSTGEIENPDVNLYDSNNDFNPSLIILYKDRLLVSGDKSNPIQVKTSEWNNPDNFIDNVLGAQTSPLSSKDTARASTFIIPTGCDVINSLDVFNDVVYIGTNKSWFIYQLVNQNIGDGVQFQFDSITQNNYTLAGSVNQYSTITFQNKLYFVADYQVVPEFSAFELQINTNSDRASAAYTRLSGLIDDWMEGIDLSSSCIGVYGDSVLIGCKRTGELKNTICILARPFYLSATEIRWGFTVMDHIQPAYFFQNNRGCYWMNTNSGNLYQIQSSQNGIQEYSVENSIVNTSTKYPVSVWKTHWTGLNPTRDSDISFKSFNSIKISGYFSSGTTIKCYFDCDLPDVDSEKVTYQYTEFGFKHTFDYDIPSQIEDEDIRYKYGAKHHVIMFAIPKGATTKTYRKLSMTIIVEDSKFFRFEEYLAISEELAQNGNAIEKPIIIEPDGI